jgi:BirA family transcriptional regulator, biotin operon repressor / biotin---[acetyl-CoA-carboxylase] ligase
VPELLEEVQLPPFELLELLADGELHSGQELAKLLGVSRTAVWKQLAKLQTLGLELQSAPGKGYRLVGGIELLSKEKIIGALLKSCLGQISQLTILKAIDSTNSFLLQQAPREKITICLAECQTAGRGRRGRTWVSPFAKNIYLSFKMTLEGGVSVLEGLSLAIGVAIARSLRLIGVPDARLKWPNDVLWHNQKLAGVLIEVVGDPAGVCHLVVGVGLNVLSVNSMNMNISQPWVSLQEIAKLQQIQPPGRNMIAAALIAEIVPLLAQYEQQGFSGYRAEWESLNAYTDRVVDVHVGSTIVSGILLGVDSVGALVLTTDEGERVFHGGEVSLREALS